MYFNYNGQKTTFNEFEPWILWVASKSQCQYLKLAIVGLESSNNLLVLLVFVY